MAATDSLAVIEAAREVVDGARYAAEVALERYLTAGDWSAYHKGMGVLERMQEFAAIPIANANVLPDPNGEIWALEVMWESFLRLRREFANALVARLADLRPLPRPAAAAPAAQPAIRVCDCVYLMLHRLAQTSAPQQSFVALTPSERDAAVEEFRLSRELRRLTER